MSTFERSILFLFLSPKSRFSPTIKVDFFGFYVNGVTLADGEGSLGCNPANSVVQYCHESEEIL